MRSPPQPRVARDHPHPLPESHMLVLEDTMRRHAPTDSRTRHIQAAVLLLLAACVLLILIDNLPDFRAIASPPTGQAVQHPGGASGAGPNTVITCHRDRVCAEGGS